MPEKSIENDMRKTMDGLVKEDVMTSEEKAKATMINIGFKGNENFTIKDMASHLLIAEKMRLGTASVIEKEAFEALGDKGKFDIKSNLELVKEIEKHSYDRSMALYQGLEVLAKDTNDLNDLLIKIIPRKIKGTILQPNDTPAEHVKVSVYALKLYTRKKQQEIFISNTLTNIQGKYEVPINQVYDTERLKIVVEGYNGETESREYDISEVNALVGVKQIKLKYELAPFPRSILSHLGEIVENLPVGEGSVEDGGDSVASEVTITQGEGDNELKYKFDLTEDKMNYGVLIRLVEPMPTRLTKASVISKNGRSIKTSLMFGGVGSWGDSISDWYENIGDLYGGIEDSETGYLVDDNELNFSTEFVNRVPIDSPINITKFRNKLIGNINNEIDNSVNTPIAGTLGLGYVVLMSQTWQPKGLTLGNLLYSLPLSPGEQQRIAIIEKDKSSASYESVDYSLAESRSFSSKSNNSVQSVFDSAYREASAGSSVYSANSSSSSGSRSSGFFGAIFGGGSSGGGKTNSSGSSGSSMSGARDYVSNVSEAARSSIRSQASGRRDLSETYVRLAKTTENESVTTKTITNHNRIHALTLQYWEVLKQYEISTGVNGVQLVCYVPLDPIRFLDHGQELSLSINSVDTKKEAYNRYKVLAMYADELMRRLPYKHRKGLRKLKNWLYDPNSDVKLGTFENDTLNFTISGTFCSLDNVYVRLIMKDGSQGGEYRLIDEKKRAPVLPEVGVEEGELRSKGEIYQWIDDLRSSNSITSLRCQRLLPSNIEVDEIAGFEIRRTYNTLRTILDKLPGLNGFTDANTEGEVDFGFFKLDRYDDIVIYSHDFERIVLPPEITHFSADIQYSEADTLSLAPIVRNRKSLVGRITQYPALRIAPQLTYDSLLQIESCLQHVVNNTIYYSKVIWQSLTSEERAILLEQYTIGVPSGGIEDESSDIPLLNCIANEVVGFYGNCMIMPFNIPGEITAKVSGTDSDIPLTTGNVQDILYEYHKKCFRSSKFHINLPTKGVLGEAVLGQSPSAEKIDLTRFWKWSDAPLEDKATLINPIATGTVPTLDAQRLSSLSGTPTYANMETVAPYTPNLSKDMVNKNVEAFKDITNSDALKNLITSTVTEAGEALDKSYSTTESVTNKAMESVQSIIETAITKQRAGSGTTAKPTTDDTKTDKPSK